MKKGEVFDEFFSMKPRKIDKKKHHSKGFTEDALDQRANRINFKNYIRQVKEQEAMVEVEEWIVERGTVLEGELHWTEIESFTTEIEADQSAFTYGEFDTYGDQYRIRKV